MVFCYLCGFNLWSAAPAGGGLDPVTLQLKWQHQFQFAGYYAAIEKGYYRDAGLDVTLREAQPGLDPVKSVLEGKAQFGVGTSELLLLRATGKDVVVLAAIFQHSPLVLLSRHGNIHDIHDLAHQPVMIEPQSAELFAYFKVEGVDPGHLNIQHHTFRVEDLLQGKVAAMSAYSTDEPFQLRQAKFDYLEFTPRAGGIDFYGDNLFTTAEEIKLHPERVRAFRAASLHGWDYALAHPQEIVDLILKKYSQRKTRAHLLFEAEQTAQLMHPGLIEVGHMNPGRWRHIADTYAEFKMVPRDFNLDGFMYDPAPHPNMGWVYLSIGIAVAVALTAVGWALPLYRMNQRLQRAVADTEAANRAKSRYLAFIAHEVRTPLGGIISMMRLVGTQPLTSEQQENLKLVERSAESLLKLVGDTLDYSKIESGGFELEKLPVNPEEFLWEICELFRPSAQAKGVTLSYDVEPGVPSAILTDSTRLRQVLTNLLSNAIKFTAKGSVEVHVQAGQIINPDVPGETVKRRLFFQVKDTGEGIAPEVQERLFQPYNQADATISRRYGGTGLGLSISRSIAKLLGGDIKLESSPGKGSTFTVEIIAEVAKPADSGNSV